MRTLAIITAILIALVIGVMYAISALFDFPTVTYRYRLSIAVESDSQVHSGSSVIEITTTFFPHWAAGMANGIQLHSTDKGQGVFIDLGAHGALVAALGGENYDCTVNALYLASRAFGPPAPRVPPCTTGYPATLDGERAIARMTQPATLTADNMPAFFWFPDPSNLATVKEVKPDDFAAVIGDTTRLVSAQIKITSDPITIDIDKKLPAYAALRSLPNNGAIYTTPGGLILGWRQFISLGDK